MSDTQVPPSFRQGKGNKLNSYELAKYLVEAYHVINLHDMLYIYAGGIHVHKMKRIESLILELAGGAKPAEVKAVIRDLSIIAPVREESSYRYVAFNNCIVDIQTLHTFEFNPDEFVITSKVYANYVPDKMLEEAVQLVDKFFADMTCGDMELQITLLTIILYCMLRTAMYHRAFILYGNASNAKSDFLHIISKLLGEFCTHQNLFQLSNLNNLKYIFQRTANIIDDVTEIARVDLAKMHSIISGGKLAIKVAGDEEFSFCPYATLLLATTHTLDFSGCNDEDIRRFKVIPFEAKFDSDTVDRYMTEKITSQDCLDVIATRAIQTASNLGREWKFPASVEIQTSKYFSEGNPILAFGKTVPIKRIITVDDYYSKFCVWYMNIFAEMTDISKAVFGKRLSNLLNIKSKPFKIDGKLDTFYTAKDFNLQQFRVQYKEYCNSCADGETPMTLLQYVNYLDKLDEQVTE